ncbi:MAG: hypothetical protein NTY61_02340, partial [Candidatus Parcubacteria bacterium]|nr:hypothetical protein [Candidatus Parcubacteria bacterium]
MANANLNNSTDSDGDGLSDAAEDALGTDKNSPDTDGDGYTDGDEVSHGYSSLGPGKTSVNSALVKKLAGKILLQTQSHGEAWYVNPVNGQRYFLGRPEDAFAI